MTSKGSTFALEIQTSLNEAIKLIREKKFSRIPVYSGDNKRVIGVFYAKDLLRLWKEKKKTLAELVRPAYFIPESRKVSEVLRDFQDHRIHIAVVVNDQERFAGILTMQDILGHLFREAYLKDVSHQSAGSDGGQT